MPEKRYYTRSEVEHAVRLALENLDNCRSVEDVSKGDDDMSRMKAQVEINGELRWITGTTPGDLIARYIELTEKAKDSVSPTLKDVMHDFVEVYKSHQESLTKINRERIIRNHIEPRFGDYKLTDISTAEIQKWMDELAEKYSHETLLKIRNTMSPVLDAAVEDGYISKNPFKSVRLTIRGRETKGHKRIPREIMKRVRDSTPVLESIFGVRERRMCALLCYTGMRFEEILGLRWNDIRPRYFNHGTIHVERAVVHPMRNQPEVKPPKTASSKRDIPYTDDFVKAFGTIESGLDGYILYSKSGNWGEKPLSYSEARNCFNHIRAAFGLSGYSSHDFRDTAATEWRENGVSTDIIARFLGHSDSSVTEKRYVHYDDIVGTEMERLESNNSAGSGAVFGT